MGDLALRFRKRAEECRRLAVQVPDLFERDNLTKTALELEEVADLMDAEKACEHTSG